jgi:hypothetical protein
MAIFNMAVCRLWVKKRTRLVAARQAGFSVAPPQKRAHTSSLAGRQQMVVVVHCVGSGNFHGGKGSGVGFEKTSSGKKILKPNFRSPASPNSPFSILHSPFSILNSQFSIFNSQFSINYSPWSSRSISSIIT